MWVQPQSTEQGFSPDLVSPTRRAFLAWNELALGVAFEMIDDSTQADVHVTWRAQMVKAKQLGTTFRMTAGSGWVAFAHVILSTSYDIYTVQNAARHEAGVEHFFIEHDNAAEYAGGSLASIATSYRNLRRLLP